jgi:hypothetical protein
MDIISIHDDLLANDILSLLRPSSLINFALSCKRCYEQRRLYLKSNKYIELYRLYDDNQSYMTVLFNSHFKLESLADVSIKSFELKNELSVNLICIKNTTKIIDFHLSKFVLHDYYISMLSKQFGYTSSVYCNSILRSMDSKWHNSNVLMYDIYQLIYHVTKRNYRSLQATLQNIIFIKTIYPYYTLSLLLKFINKITDTKIMLVIIYVYFRFVEYVFEELKQDQKKDFIHSLCGQAESFAYVLKNNNQFPKYIKNIIHKQFRDVIALAKSL